MATEDEPDDDRERSVSSANWKKPPNALSTGTQYWLRTGEWPIGRALAMMGRFGWSIVTPILLGCLHRPMA